MAGERSALTVLLTLKGRPLHTLRWLWHANRTRLPFRVMVADGEVHPTIARLLSDPATFPNLAFEYRQYDDRSFTDFYRKCVDALGRIDTPYVMMSDNDDFLFPSGVAASVDFLEREKGFVSSCGGVTGFSVRTPSGAPPTLVGSVERVRYRYLPSYASRDIAQDLARERLFDELGSYMTVYYSVYRTTALRTIADEILRHDFRDSELHEFFWAGRTAVLGRIHGDASHLSYFRQIGTSSNFAYGDDWVSYLVGSRLPDDAKAFADSLAAEAAAADGVDAAPIEQRLRAFYVEYLKRTLSSRVLRHRFPKLFRARMRLNRLRGHPPLPGTMLRDADLRRVWNELAAAGATSSTIAAHKAELADIRATLDGAELLAFLRERAPDLLDAAR